MKRLSLSLLLAIAALFVATSSVCAEENRDEPPEWDYSDVKAFIKSKSTDRDFQKYLLKQARDAYRAVGKIKEYKKLTPAEVIAIKWDCFDDFPHDWNMINYVLMDRIFEANKEKK